MNSILKGVELTFDVDLFTALKKIYIYFIHLFIHKIHRWMPMSNFHYFYLYFITHFIIDNEQQQKHI